MSYEVISVEILQKDVTEPVVRHSMKVLYPPVELMDYLRSFRPFLSRRQFRHLTSYVTGLIACKRKSVLYIARSCLCEGDQSSLNRFLHSKAWRIEDLNRALIRKVWKELTVETHSVIYLILDDTLLEKFGKHMELTGYLFSPKHGKHILCHDIVSTHVFTEEGEGFPVDLRLYVRKDKCREADRTFKSRIELAVDLIQSFQPPENVKIVVLMDAWYFCRDVVEAIRDRGWHYIAEAKSNRIAYHHGKRFHLSELPLTLKHQFRDVEADGDLYAAVSLQVEIPKLGFTTLAMESRLQEKRDPIHFLVSDLLDPDHKLIEAFRKRHKIEEFYRDAKQNLGLEGYMVRSVHASNRHWRLVFLAYTLLVLLKRGIVSLAEKTIGELCEWIYDKCIEGLISRIYHLFKLGATLPEALKSLKQTAKL